MSYLMYFTHEGCVDAKKRTRRERNQRFLKRQKTLIEEGEMLRKVRQIKDAYTKGYVLFKNLLQWTGVCLLLFNQLFHT